jgi:hypothetical protein
MIPHSDWTNLAVGLWSLIDKVLEFIQMFLEVDRAQRLLRVGSQLLSDAEDWLLASLRVQL